MNLFLKLISFFYREKKEDNKMIGDNGLSSFAVYSNFFDRLNEKTIENLTQQESKTYSLKIALEDRDFYNIEKLLDGMSKEDVAKIVSKDAFIKFFSGINEKNITAVLNIYEKYSLEPIWTRKGINIKSLYSQRKVDVIEYLLLNIDIDVLEYEQLRKFMEKRSKTNERNKEDFKHLIRFVDAIVLELELEEAIPINTKVTKVMKF